MRENPFDFPPSITILLFTVSYGQDRVDWRYVRQKSENKLQRKFVWSLLINLYELTLNPTELPVLEKDKVKITMDTICWLDIIFILHMGYYKYETKEVILDHSLIIKRYLKGMFWFDFFATCPVLSFCQAFYRITDLTESPGYIRTIYLILVPTRFFRILRLVHILNYLLRFTTLVGFSEIGYKISSTFLLFVLGLWLCTCLLLAGPLAEALFDLKPRKVKEDSVHVIVQMDDPRLRFRVALSETLIDFVRAGDGRFKSDSFFTIIVSCFAQLLGYLFFAYATVIVLQLLSSRETSLTKYEEMRSQIQQYAQNIKLPQPAMDRLDLYFRTRFRYKLFQEEVILQTLSEHLRMELLLHNFRILLYRVDLFKDLPRSLVGSVIYYLKCITVLPNEVIFSCGNVVDAMYFISCGTVAMYTQLGYEHAHLHDYDFFGEVGLFDQRRRRSSAVAVSPTELFKFDVKDIKKTAKMYPDFKDRLIVSADNRLTKYSLLEAKARRDRTSATDTGTVDS